MVRQRLPQYVREYVDCRGRLRRYLRKPGLPQIPLPTDCGAWSPELLMARDAALAGATLPIVSPMMAETAAGSVASAVAGYLASPSLRALALSYQRKIRKHLEHFRERHGCKTLAGLDAETLQGMLEPLRPHAQKSVRKTLRGLFGWAKAEKIITRDPTALIKAARPAASDGFRMWEEEHIAAFRTRWPLGTQERLALELILNFGARARSDGTRLGRQNIRDGWLRFRPQKNGKIVGMVEIPVLPDFQAAAAHLPADQMLFLLGRTGKPMAGQTFGDFFKAAVRAAKLPEDLSAHGLRKASATRVAEATGGDLLAVLGVLGDKDWRMAQLYCDKAKRRLAVASAYARIGAKSRPASG